MTRYRSLLAVVAGTAVAAFGVTACGGGSDDDSSGGGSGKSGGTINIGTVGPDSYDPALFQTVQASQALSPVYTPLTKYAPKEGKAGGEIVPGLADLPKVTNGGKTYTYQLKKGINFSDGTPVKASDYEHAIKRVVGQKGPYSSFFTGIVGAEEFQKDPKASNDIKGITTDDKTGKIVVELKAPDGKFPFAQSVAYAAPVKASSSPIKDMTKNPPIGSGPYTLKVVDPSKKFVLTKNKNFNVPGVEKGKVDKINGLVSDSVERQTQDVISGKLDFTTEDPSGNLLPQVRSKYKDRIREDANPPNTYYFFLNVTEPPFNKLEARQAVNYAIDSRALVRIFGGRLEPGCTFLPPQLVGYKDFKCPYGDPGGPGNVKKAKELVEKSGTKGQQVTVWTNNKSPRDKIAVYYAGVLEDIGYKTKIKTLDQQVYFDRIGTKSSKAQTGFTDWYQDFPHPADFFQPLLTGDSLQSTPTSNQGFVNDATLNKKSEDLVQEPDLEKAAPDWGDLDEYVVKDKAYIVPYGYEKATSFFSERMDFDNCAGVHPVYKNDWTQFCLK